MPYQLVLHHAQTANRIISSISPNPTGPMRTATLPNIELPTSTPGPSGPCITAVPNLEASITTLGAFDIPSLLLNRTIFVMVTIALLLSIWIYRSIPKLKRFTRLVRYLVSYTILQVAISLPYLHQMAGDKQ